MYRILREIARFGRAVIWDRLYWQGNFSQRVRCQIDARSSVKMPYSLKDVEVGYGTYIAPNSQISRAKIGRFCSIGPNFFAGWGIHPLNGISTSPIFYSTATPVGFTYSKENKIIERKEIVIGNDVFVGANVTVLDGVQIGDGAVIGAGAVVNKEVPPYAIAIGCPAKVIKFRFDPITIERLLALRWWERDEYVHRQVEADFFNVEEFLIKMEGNK